VTTRKDKDSPLADLEPMLTGKQVMDYFQISETSLRNARRSGLKHTWFGSEARYKMSWIEEWQASKDAHRKERAESMRANAQRARDAKNQKSLLGDES